jgi:uncharacterized membrane protein YjgN (DUF898 family)
MEVENQKLTPVEFRGNAQEYFGIWIVNLLLSLVTLGIYSAWAKVRRKKYFYNNTLIDNVAFDYHAKPTSILKGRIVAFIFFFFYSASASISMWLPYLFLLMFFLALPWLVVRGSTFNARNTSHRGLRFNFVGDIGEAFGLFVGMPLLNLITLGLATPLVTHQKRQYIVNNHRFGTTAFKMKSVVHEFFMVYIKLWAIPVIITIIAVIAGIAFAFNSLLPVAKPSNSLANVSSFAEMKQPILLAENGVKVEKPEVPAEFNVSTQATIDALKSEDLTDAERQKIVADWLENEQPSPDEVLADEAATADEFAADAQAEVDEELTPEQVQAQEKAKIAEKIKEWLKDPMQAFAALGVFFVVMAVYIFFIFGFLGYLQARLGNLIWNNTTLDKLSFKSTLRARDFMWLYFSNIVAIMLTLGLATPWAQIRMVRYRAEKLQIVGDVDFEQFVGDKKAEMQAAGEEIADFFDVDLSFG